MDVIEMMPFCVNPLLNSALLSMALSTPVLSLRREVNATLCGVTVECCADDDEADAPWLVDARATMRAAEEEIFGRSMALHTIDERIYDMRMAIQLP